MDTDSTTKSGPEGLGSIVSGIVKDLQEVMRGEVKLAKAEIKEDVSAMGKGATSIATGGVIAFVGFVFLMLSAMFLLDKWFEMWIAAGIVAVALLLIGAILAMSGKKKLSASSLKPTESIESLKEDQAWASQQIKSVRK